jgi:hypothetical protein
MVMNHGSDAFGCQNVTPDGTGALPRRDLVRWAAPILDRLPAAVSALRVTRTPACAGT